MKKTNEKENANDKKKQNLFSYVSDSLMSAKFQPGSLKPNNKRQQHQQSDTQIPALKQTKKILQYQSDEDIQIKYPYKYSQTSKDSRHQGSIQLNDQLLIDKKRQTKIISEIDKKLKITEETFKAALQYAIKKNNEKIEAVKIQNNQCLQELVAKVNKRFLRQDKNIQSAKEDIDIERNNIITLKDYIQEYMANTKIALEQLGLDEQNRKSKLNYSINLKNSVQQLQMMQKQMIPQNQEIESIKRQIEDVKKYIGNFESKFKEMNFHKKEQINFEKIPNRSSLNQQQIFKINQKIQNLVRQVDLNKRLMENKLNQQNCTMKITMKVIQQNMTNINEEFKRVINSQFTPKIDQLQSEIKYTSNNLMVMIKEYYNQAYLQNTQKIKTLKIRDMTKTEKDKIKHLSGQISYKETYLLDEHNYLLDSSGIYLVDQNKQRIQITEDQIYFLQVQGIQICQAT